MTFAYLVRPMCCVAAAVVFAGCATPQSYLNGGRAWTAQQKPTTACRLRRDAHCFATNNPANLSILPGVSIVSRAKPEPRN